MLCGRLPFEASVARLGKGSRKPRDDFDEEVGQSVDA